VEHDLWQNISWNVHLVVHTDAKLYSCRHCSFQFRTEFQRKRHLLESHNEGTWFTCHICEKKYAHQCHLKIHLFTHEDVKPYICAVCPKRFFTAGHLKRHQSVHSDYKQFICGLCNKLFKGKSAVQIHFKKCCTLLEFDWWICIYVIFCVFTARRYAKRGMCRRRVSVCLSVCHTPVLYQNG